MEFLLNITIRGTRDLDDEARERMLAEEHARGEELARHRLDPPGAGGA